MAARGPAGSVIIVYMCYIYISWVHKTGFPAKVALAATPDRLAREQTRQQFYQPIAVAATHGESQSLGVLIAQSYLCLLWEAHKQGISA